MFSVGSQQIYWKLESLVNTWAFLACQWGWTPVPLAVRHWWDGRGGHSRLTVPPARWVGSSGQGLRDWPHWLKPPDQRSNVGGRASRRSIPPQSLNGLRKRRRICSHTRPNRFHPARAFNSVERQLPWKQLGTGRLYSALRQYIVQFRTAL